MNEPSSSAGCAVSRFEPRIRAAPRVILMLADGASYSTIEATVPCFRDYINRWRRRFLADRLEGLRRRYKGHPCGVIDRDAWRSVPE
jgi:hypothetical protein